MKFESFIKESISVSPGRNLDHLVLTNANAFFPEKESEWAKVLVPVLMFCLVLVFVGRISIQNEPTPNIAKMDESIELISHYDEIELMADASLLTDKEWERIK